MDFNSDGLFFPGDDLSQRDEIFRIIIPDLILSIQDRRNGAENQFQR